MDELKCKVCGTVLAQGEKECPSCGYPVEEVKVEYKAPAKKHTAKKFNVTSIISLILGVVIIIMGIAVMNKDVNTGTYIAQPYDADYAEFGADFYTYIYNASDTIVDELNDINGGVALLSRSVDATANVICYTAGMLIIALGLGVVAVSCNHIKKENA